MSSLQDTIARAIGSISCIIDTLLQAREKKCHVNCKSNIVLLLDCTVSLDHVNQEMSFRRRNSLCPQLSNDW